MKQLDVTGILYREDASANGTAVRDWNIRSERSKFQLNSLM